MTRAAGGLEAVHESLVERDWIEALSCDPGDTATWLDFELASMVENRFRAGLDPWTLSPEERLHWRARAVAKDETMSDPHARAWMTKPFWILDEGRRVGTIGLSSSEVGTEVQRVWSLYVLPRHRGRGIASRLLRSLHEQVVARGSWGLRVPTHWTWQHAVSFYLRLGLWVVSWKHSLDFGTRAGMPQRSIDIHEDEALFSVVREGRREELVRASIEGDRLVWIESPELSSLWDSDADLYLYGRATFALALALRGWPLVRSDEDWAKRHHSCDIGDPEGLAYKIEIFEAIDRGQGFDVRCPRIPALLYRDLSEID